MTFKIVISYIFSKNFIEILQIVQKIEKFLFHFEISLSFVCFVFCFWCFGTVLLRKSNDKLIYQRIQLRFQLTLNVLINNGTKVKKVTLTLD